MDNRAVFISALLYRSANWISSLTYIRILLWISVMSTLYCTSVIM